MSMQQQQYWPQAAYAAGGYVPQASAGAAAYYPAYNPYAQQQQQQAQMMQAQMQAYPQAQQQYMYQQPQQYQPQIRSAGNYDWSEENSSHGGGAHKLPAKARQWTNKVKAYSERMGISFKEALIKLKGTGSGSGTTKRHSKSGSRSRSRRGGNTYDEWE
jgi:hypothetical protein